MDFEFIMQEIEELFNYAEDCEPPEEITKRKLNKILNDIYSQGFADGIDSTDLKD